MRDVTPFQPGTFSWLLGIEDTCVYPHDRQAASLDEHFLTGHSEQWQADLVLARGLGATALRYGVSWPLVHVAPGEFDWTVLDEIIPFAVDDLGLTIVADLVHYGTPTWLPQSFADPSYPAAIEEFAGAFAARYIDRINHFTPLNEPVTTASFCGLRGIWPPHLIGWPGWVAVTIPMALGIARSVAAIRRANPDAVIVHVEASTVIQTADQSLTGQAELLRGIGWLPTDLLLGRVDRSHVFHGWLLEYGANAADLDWLTRNPTRVDLMGVNYYPDLNPRILTLVEGKVVQLSHDRWTVGLSETIRAFADRYGLPILVTETSIEGDTELRARWLHDSAGEVDKLIASGIDIRGYTWWPLFDFVDWSWAAGGANVEEFVVALATVGGETKIASAPPLGDPAAGKAAFLRRMGLVRLEEQADGTLLRVVTPAALVFEQLAGADT